MATPTQPPDPSISAAELRRRLLTATPPPVAGPDPEPAVPVTPGAAIRASSHDLLSRLRMPGGSPGTVPTPPARSFSPPPVLPEPEPEPDLNRLLRASPSRRTPPPVRHPAGLEPTSAIAGALNTLAGIGEGTGRLPIDDSPMAEIQRLRAENRDLRQLIEEVKPLLQEAAELEKQFTGKEAVYTTTLAEKDGQIEELSAQLGAIEEQIAKGELAPPPPTPKTRTELEEWNDELEKESAKLTQERKKLEAERRQLQEDEEGLEKQMREMEVSMARERAMLARQETELKRLSAEIQHELDLLQRGDAGLREQMAKFQRRAQEVMTSRTSMTNLPTRR